MSGGEPRRRALDLDTLRRAAGLSLRTTPATMRAVLWALVPGTVLYAVLIDIRVILNLAVAMLAATLCEAMAMHVRRRPVLATVSDGSAALTGALLALSVPPGLPLWQLILGTTIATLLAKQVFGGLGQNPFNPAMVGLAVLLVSFPATMTHWPHSADPQLAPIFQDTTRTVDALTAQTPLDRWREQARGHSSGDAITPGVAWSLLGLGWLAGGLWLLWRRIISWHAPVAMLLTLTACHGFAALFSSEALSLSTALLSGATLFGAFFIITDPVSGAATPRGRILFGVGVALITFAIRQFGSWPEGLAFAVLIMNGAVPLIDRLDTPRP